MTRRAGPRTVVGAVIIDCGRVLAARRAVPADLAGGWEFPGGKVEDGETLEGALRREVAEELDLAIVVGPELAGPDGAWPISSAYELRLFIAAVAGGGDPTPGPDHDQVRWLDADELDAVAWLPADRQAMDAVRALLAAEPSPEG